jgi:hypothetical protein
VIGDYLRPSFDVVDLPIETVAITSACRHRADAEFDLTEWVRREGHTLIEGTVSAMRRRYRGRFATGWTAWARAIRDGASAHGLGESKPSI